MGQGKPDAPKPTEADLANARNALDTLKQHQQYILPLELEEIRHTFDPGTRAAKEGILDRGANITAMAAEAQSRAAERALAAKAGMGLRSAGTQARMAAVGDQGMRNAAQSLADAGVQGNKLRLSEKFGLLESGQSIARQRSQGLGQMAFDASNAAVSRFRSDSLAQEARAKALGDLALRAGAYGYESWQAGKDPYTPWEEVGVLGRINRQRQMSDYEGHPGFSDPGTLRAFGQRSRDDPMSLGDMIKGRITDLWSGENYDTP